MKRKLYLETSFWNRLGDRENLEMRRLSYRFLNRSCARHDVLVSPLVLEEVGDTPDPEERTIILRQLRGTRPTMVANSRRARVLAAEIRAEGGFGERMLDDLTHVAYAVLGGADAVVTWDRRTLARDRVRLATQGVRAATRAWGAPDGFARGCGEMARPKDVRLTQVRRIRRRIGDRLRKAEREGRLDEALRDMERRARRLLAGDKGATKPKRRVAP